MSRILLILKHKENSRLLSEWLGNSYQVLLPKYQETGDDTFWEEPFDLCIIDGYFLHLYWERVKLRRKSEQPVFLPILFVTSYPNVTLETRNLWEFIDKLVITPIAKKSLQTDVEVLLRSRRLSLQLKLNQSGEEFDNNQQSKALALLQLEADLRKAIEEGNQFQVYYQPIVSLQQGTIAGFEALVRWNHPKQGLIAPDKFIPVAEETGLILYIDLWVLQEACRQMRIWQLSLPGAARLKISVNFSSKQFSQLNLQEKIARILKETDLEPESLKLELTETKLLDIAQSTMTTLLETKSLGIELVLDDFGTGYASFSYLHNVPIDALKIDRSFIWKMGADENSKKIVLSIIHLSHKLGMYAIAEGVETVEQFAQLKKWGCEYGQGYLFAKPLNSAAAWELIASKPIWS